MNSKKYNWILYLISATIVVTLAVQLYWNYKNYQQNKQLVINQIQQSLDDALEEYYSNLSKKNMLAFVKTNNFIKIDSIKGNHDFKYNIQIEKLEYTTDNKNEFEDLKIKYKDSTYNSIIIKTTDSLKNSKPKIEKSPSILDSIINPNQISSVSVFKGKKATDSLKLIKGLETIYIALKTDSLNYSKVDSLLKKNLTNKNISINYGFNHFKNDTLFYHYDTNKNISKSLNTTSKSTFLKPEETLKMDYTIPTKETLKLSFTGILLSFILALGVISSLFYLLKIINQQKQLAEIKNDLISNITHEFKTPIATVSAAVEALNNFNDVKDEQKTKTYLNISSVQLKKLHNMVEKLLETATLDSENLLINKEPNNLVNLTKKLVNKHRLIADSKQLNFSSNTKEFIANVDSFHLENAISNLIDNAIKYGGNVIDISVTSILNSTEITIADNGSGIDKSQQNKIFDKFYRIPKGNIHNVKGFGIGLYYSKKIVEKHNGHLTLISKPNSTVFKISLPNE